MADVDPRAARPSVRSVATPTLLVSSAALLAAFFGGYELLERFVLAPYLTPPRREMLHIIRGITASTLLASFVAYHLIRHPLYALQAMDRSSASDLAQVREPRRDQIRWLIQMRWLAAGFALALIVISIPLTSVLSSEHLPALLFWWGLLVGFNLYFGRVADADENFDRQITAQLIFDTVVLTGLLNASGGIENPLSIAYLFEAFIAGILLPKRKALAITAFASGALAVLVLGELFHILPHATMLLFPHNDAFDSAHHAAYDPVFVSARLTSLIGVMFVTSYFTTLTMDRLRESEGDLNRAATTAMLERRRLEGVIEAAGFGVVVITADGRIEWINQRIAAWMEWKEPVVGYEARHEHEKTPICFLCAAEKTLWSGEAHDVEICVAASGTRMRYFRHATFPVRDVEGHIVQTVHMIEDVTARKVLEAEALHTGRLAVLGQLAAGIAHEIGNPLSSLQARLQLMKRRPDSDFIRSSMEVLEKQIERIGRIIRGVSHLARNRYDGATTIDVNAVVREAIALVKVDRRAANVVLSEELAEELPAVRGVRDQLQQVVINLLLNALEAMPQGGRLGVRTFASVDTVKIAISDSGPGIEESVRERLFEPFFTTKPEGTGLGLSICTSVAHAHGGTIEVASEMGRGSCFTLVLPTRPALEYGKEEVA